MTDSFDFANFQSELAAASAALRDFAQNRARSAGEEVGAAFERAGARIARAMGRAARDGEASFKRMAKSILEELARLALDRIFTQTPPRTHVFGARANGGAVTAGGAYLVGERGPEWFVPHAAGVVAAPGAGAVAVHFHFAERADSSEIVRHQGQIAAAIARAVAYGRRNL